MTRFLCCLLGALCARFSLMFVLVFVGMCLQGACEGGRLFLMCNVSEACLLFTSLELPLPMDS